MASDVRGMFTGDEGRQPPAAAPPPPRPRLSDAGPTTRPRSPTPSRNPARLPFVWTGRSHSREGEMYRRVVRDLSRQIGGRPTPAQEMLIARIGWLAVHLARIDARALAAGEMSDHSRREYLAWSNTMTRTLAILGFQAAPAPPANLADYLAGRHEAPEDHANAR